MKNSYKSLLICHQNNKFNLELITSWLNSFSQLSGIIIIKEKYRNKWKHLIYEFKRSGIFGLFDVLLMRIFYKLFLQKKDEVKILDLIQQGLGNYQFVNINNLPSIYVDSPNSNKSLEFVKSIKPDFIIARCKTILKKELFNMPRLGTYVIHPGICPEYRNAHGCFWALANNDLKRIGYTLLQINEGIDTGPILSQGTTDFDVFSDSYIYIQHKVVADNLNQIKNALLSFFDNNLKIISTQNRQSRIWGQPRLSVYLKYKLRFRKQIRKNNLALLYHDVLTPQLTASETGRQEPGSIIYKLKEELFKKQLDLIKAKGFLVTTIKDISLINQQGKILLCFDDGGISNYSVIAPILDKYNWRGHFFIITEKIGKSGFMSKNQIKDLKNRGHIIGSHSHTHPNLVKIKNNEIKNELSLSKKIIEEILNEPCECLSIPEGESNKKIIEMAKKIGYKHIFTSMPQQINTSDLSVIGRWGIKYNTTLKNFNLLLNQNSLYVLMTKIRWAFIRLLIRTGGR